MSGTDSSARRDVDPRRQGQGDVARNALLKLSSEIVGRAASLALTLLAVQHLGPRGFGVYSHGLAIGLVIAQVADLGLQVTCAREVAMHGRAARRFVASAFALKFLLCLPVLLILLPLAATRTAELRSTYLWLGLAMLAQTFIEFAAHVFRGQQQIGREARLLAGARIVMLVVGAAVLSQSTELSAFALAILLSTALFGALAIRELRRDQWLAPAGRSEAYQPILMKVLRQALPLGIATVISITYTRTAILLLDYLLDEQAVAQYSAAFRLVEPLQIVPAAVMAAVFPAYARALTEDPRRAKWLGLASTVLLASLGAALGLILWLGAPWIVAVLFPDSMADSAGVLRVLGLALAPTFANYVLTHLLIARGQTHFNLLFVLLMFIVHLGVSWWLIPEHGATGAAISVVVAELGLTLFCASTLAWMPWADEAPRRATGYE